MKKILLILAAIVCMTLNAVTVRNENLTTLKVIFTNLKTGQAEEFSLRPSAPESPSSISSSHTDQYPSVTIIKPMVPVLVIFYKYKATWETEMISNFTTNGANDIKIDTSIYKPDIIDVQLKPAK